MMTIKTVMLTLSLLATPFFVQTAYAESPIQSQNSRQSITLDMQNMTCNLCKFTIKKALQAVDGVQKVDVDYDSKTAVVTFDSQKTNTESLIKATTDAGYPATIQLPHR